MDQNTLDIILKFRGDIRATFDFLMNVYDDLGFLMQTNLKAVSRPFDTFANSIRSYRQKQIIQPVEKSGVRLILTGKNLIQYLLVQRFLLIGAKLYNLKETIPTLMDKELHGMILADTLVLDDLPLSVIKLNIKPPSPTKANTCEIRTLYSVEVKAGINILIDSSQYTVKEVKNIERLVKAAL